MKYDPSSLGVAVICTLAASDPASFSVSATAPDFLEYLAVGHLDKTAPAVIRRRRHSEHANTSEPIDHFARNVCLSIYRHRIERRVEKRPQFRQRCIELGLLRRWDPRIRHHPIGN